jgi:hypothetical protein
VLAAITGALAARGSVGAAAGKVATDGAIAGGASSVVGGFLAVATGEWPGFAIVQMLGPAISGSVAGGLGGILRRMSGGKGAA